MNTILSFPQQRDDDLLGANGELDLARLLDAWQAATDRLQRTHEALREQVQRLTDELEAKNRELARKNRLADLGQMASHVAHEVRNSLMPMTLYLSLLRRHVGTESAAAEILDKIDAGLTAADATVNDLLHFAADRQPKLRWFLVQPLLVDVAQAIAPQLAAQGVALELDVPAGLALLADREMLRRAVLNLMLNALDAMPEGGTLVVSACDAANAVEIEVADSGPGLAPEALARAFEPFFTTKSGGTGLGLAIVERMADAHEGSVTAANCPEGGAAFTLRLPRRAREAVA